MASLGILAAVAAGSSGWPSEYAEGIPVPGGIKAEEWGAFHSAQSPSFPLLRRTTELTVRFSDLILVDELSRCGSGGILYGLIGGFAISIGPILHFGSGDLKRRIVPSLLKGEKRSCLAITEVRSPPPPS